MAKTGRKSSYVPAYARQALRHCLLGATNDELAKLFGVSTTTIKTWVRLHPAFAAAVKKGKHDADAKVAESLHRRALGYTRQTVKIFCNASGKVTTVKHSEHVDPDVVASIFWLKNRQPALWRDRQAHELSGPHGGPIEVSTGDLRERIASRIAGVASRLSVSGHVIPETAPPAQNGNGNGNGRHA